MVSVNDALVTILAVVFSVVELLYVVLYPVNILLTAVLPGLVLPIAYVVDRRRRTDSLGLQYPEGVLLVAAFGSVLLWILVLLVPLTTFLFAAAGASLLAILLTARAWYRVARTS